MKRITEIRAALAMDDSDGVEGVCAQLIDGQWFPLVSADVKRFEQIEMMAEMIAQQTGKTITMASFTSREDIRTIEPGRKQ